MFPAAISLNRVVTAAVAPRLRVRTGASVIISVPADVPPMLPVRLVRVTLPVEVLVKIGLSDGSVIFPVDVCKLTDCIVVLPSDAPERAMPFVPWLLIVRLVTFSLMLIL